MATIGNNEHARRVTVVIALALGAAVLQPAVAQDPKKLTVDVGDCVALEKPEERLACFEAQVDAARQRAAPASASEATGAGTPASTGANTGPGPAPEPTPSSAHAAEPIGPSSAAAVQSGKSASQPRVDENGGGAQRGSEREPVEIVATVTELRETVPNAYVITLDNGQVWWQAHPKPYPLRTGLVVRLRETKFGYRLTAPELHGQIQVERVR
jgi:hypothetical protein